MRVEKESTEHTHTRRKKCGCFCKNMLIMNCVLLITRWCMWLAGLYRAVKRASQLTVHVYNHTLESIIFFPNSKNNQKENKNRLIKTERSMFSISTCKNWKNCLAALKFNFTNTFAVWQILHLLFFRIYRKYAQMGDENTNWPHMYRHISGKKSTGGGVVWIVS